MVEMRESSGNQQTEHRYYTIESLGPSSSTNGNELTFRVNDRIFPMVMQMKSISLPNEAERQVRIHAALGNPTRFRILEILSRNPESIVADIVKVLPIAQSTVSQHLAVLKEAGLIYGEDAGSGGRCCRIDVNALSTFAQQLIGWSHRVVANAGCLTSSKDAL